MGWFGEEQILGRYILIGLVEAYPSIRRRGTSFAIKISHIGSINAHLHAARGSTMRECQAKKGRVSSSSFGLNLAS